MATTQPTVLVVMGVSGVGKSTVARRICDELGYDFAEGDEYHPAANVEKMEAGIPLDDDDRWPWLGRLHDWIVDQVGAGRSGVLTCSSLKRVYRDVLRGTLLGRVRFVHLVADEELIAKHMSARTDHFMPTSLLKSQLATLEPLEPDELADGSVAVTIEESVEQTADAALAALKEND